MKKARADKPTEKEGLFGGKLDLMNPVVVLIVTLGVSGGLVGFGVVSNDVGVVGIMVVIGMFVVISPQIIFVYQKYRHLKEMEEKFPQFLRDLIESIRSGVPFHRSIVEAGRNDYGALSTEVRKMAYQISWGVPLDRILTKFADRVKGSKRLFTSTNIIRESFISGGRVTSTLESVADNATLLEETEKEKKSMLSEYVMLMYAISLIFVVIIAAINGFLIPIFSAKETSGPAVQEVLSLENPCVYAVGFEQSVCDLYSAIGLVIVRDSKTNVPIPSNNIAVYYTSMFFLMAMMQSILSGLLAGQISEGSIGAGLKHSLILAGMTFGAFLIMIKLGLLGI